MFHLAQVQQADGNEKLVESHGKCQGNARVGCGKNGSLIRNDLDILIYWYSDVFKVKYSKIQNPWLLLQINIKSTIYALELVFHPLISTVHTLQKPSKTIDFFAPFRVVWKMCYLYNGRNFAAMLLYWWVYFSRSGAIAYKKKFLNLACMYIYIYIHSHFSGNVKFLQWYDSSWMWHEDFFQHCKWGSEQGTVGADPNLVLQPTGCRFFVAKHW